MRMQTGTRETGPGEARITRRWFTAAIPAVLAAPSVLAQDSGIRLRKLHNFEIRVTDPDRSLRFYQDLFGMPVQSRANGALALRVGDGPQFMAVRALLPGETPGIAHIGYSVDDYDPARMLAAMEAVGFERIEAPSPADPGLMHAMRMWVRERQGHDAFFFADARGLIVQLADPAYCGGTGRNGARCEAVDAPAPGLMQLSELNHFTVFVSNGAEANRFYQETFGLSVQAYQGPGSPVTGIGDGFQFVMYAGGGRGGAATPANIHHGSFNMRGFDVERVRAMLTSYGLSARDGSASGPLLHYVSLRMPNRGGAEGGTPELYFTDPDGILLQLQDISYCGGGGYLGSECIG